MDRSALFLLQGGFVSMAVRVAGVALGYGAQVLLSRLLGLHGYGLYVIALGWALVLTLPARVGFDNSALRYSTIYIEEAEGASLRGFLLVAGGAVIIASCAAAGFMVLFAGLSRSLPGPAILWGAALIMPLALIGVLSSVMRTSKRIFASQFYDQILRPLLIIALAGGAALGGLGVSIADALVITAASASLALVALVIHLARVLGPLVRTKPDYSQWREWFGLTLPLLVIGITQELLNQLEVILLGTLADPAQAGLFAAAWRLASLAPFVLAALGTVSGPLVASAHRRRDIPELQRISLVSARLGLACAAAIAVLLVAVGRPLLAIFGPEFPQAYPALIILLIGGLVNSFTGIVAYFLTLTGRQLPALLIFAGALILSLALNLALIPRFGIVGAAAASASALAAWNIAMWVYVRRTLGIDASAIGLAARATAMV